MPVEHGGHAVLDHEGMNRFRPTFALDRKHLFVAPLEAVCGLDTAPCLGSSEPSDKVVDEYEFELQP